MLWAIFIFLLAMWAVGWAFDVAGHFIHLLLVLAILVAALNLSLRHRSL
jgi:hypothetical protein